MGKTVDPSEGKCFYCGGEKNHGDLSICVRDVDSRDSRRIAWDRGFATAKLQCQVSAEDKKDVFFLEGFRAYARGRFTPGAS